MRIQAFCGVTLCCQLSNSQWLEESSNFNFKVEAGILILKSLLHFTVTGLAQQYSTICEKKIGQLSMAKVDVGTPTYTW
jgi:hypothetical protein